ncbi:hypothetical protein A2962_03225 [Candidatus Woesebacteria bacterium RIFCSPLOWO2_01_FULL_39_61]|uniref:Fibronectin type-III domain-containing protein n=1 Tax=Candidatus Woesebacteria bacterium RIFCSPHIGHO2_02_FULL_39_13 TaxID=1802505 RepID=A0A1F7Z520_9BACT|nr:MAG: hypothetical protein A2692_04310 [Candidatus Woesebacteria bacterium RIFCSPHIGHO2_01_FULL_39_95]OGM33835.1 MAG: hypothetical protein A3D01_02595 [Candidatus Woesebacteria bacterium RIFCSPHIGHO2_02_FULL_39_13]OGM38996.1 MAG: hypothetical protein A3E13_04865 [Candidatus Woesebacteria bacterium RIFCSPHIGHO2_12_FULL_40_20]OGM67501.1 MAG: hypothetical protein A2962_03225 [Candidatus Woesebacteria bacterium RIFCSPLOWO2_01_FULL_39_61]OGM72832.1 MAG: hypothetical protein A3H19_05730 [Candidatus
MKLVKRTLLSLILLLGLLSFASEANAQSAPPEFPACTNPGGTLRISYADGEHAIVGESGLRVGADAVYDLEGGNVQQCFCSVDGSGVQTNWWKISSLDQDEIDTLVKLGWNFVPSGTPWGLDSSAYMAKNEAYACGGGFTTTTTSSGNPGAPSCTADRPSSPQITSIVRNGSSATISWTKSDKATHYTIAYGTVVGNYPYGVPNTGNVTSYTINALDPNTFYYYEVYAVNICMPSEPSSGGQVLGAPTGGVLGLAATGNLELIVAYLTIGAASIIAGILLKKRSDRKA